MLLRRSLLPLLLYSLSFAFGPATGWPEEHHPPASDPRTVQLYFYTAENCPHCQEIRPLIVKLAGRYEQVRLIERDIWKDRVALQELIDLLATYGSIPVSTPAIFLGDRKWVGLDREKLAKVEAAVKACKQDGCRDAIDRLSLKGGGRPVPSEVVMERSDTSEDLIELPFLGSIDAREVSLPVVTLLLGFLDSFNPCAFFVLLFLLSLMIHAHSRPRMLLVGFVFVIFSGLIYFLFMAAWLNLFLVVEGVRIITAGAGILAIAIGLINVKDYFMYQHGVSLTMSEKGRSRLIERSRKLVLAGHYPTLLIGTVVLAVAANSYELLCTAGFPMVYTRILTLNALPVWQYYAYLGLYNIVYVIPLLLIVVVFAVTLGAHKLTEHEGRVLKLISGVMMAELGLILLVRPGLLNNLAAASLLIVSTVVIVVIALGFNAWRQKSKPL